MGYRSQVVMAISPEKIGYLLTLLSQSPKAMELFQEGLEEGMKDYHEEGDMLLVWNSIKWYSGYEEVDTFDKFCDDLDCNPDADDGHDHFRFVRVGEDDEDIITKGGYGDIYPSTSITY